MIEFFNWLLGLKQRPIGFRAAPGKSSFIRCPRGCGQSPARRWRALALVGIWYLYRGEASNVGRAMRLLLIGLRGLVLVCVAFMLLELVLVITKHESAPSQLVVLVDTSESMGLNDPYPDDEVQATLAGKLGYEGAAAMQQAIATGAGKRALEKTIGKLSEGRNVSVYGFSQKAAALQPDEIAAATARRARDRHRRRAGGGAGRASRPAAGRNTVVSDGQSNAGEDPRKVAEQAGKQGVPVVALAVGSEQGPSNARLAAIEADPVVFVRDPTEVAVLVEGHGMPDRTGVVTLEKRQDTAWTEVGREEVTFNEDAATKRLAFKITPDAVGELEFRAKIADLGVELTEADNFATHAMKVVRQQIRVLLMAGAPSPEVQFLRNALLRDTGLEFACWLQSAGDGYEQMGTRPIRRLAQQSAGTGILRRRDPVRSRHAGPGAGLVGVDQPVRRHGGRRAGLCRRRNAHAQPVRWRGLGCGRCKHLDRQQRLAADAAGRRRPGLVQVQRRSVAQRAGALEPGADAPRDRPTRSFSSTPIPPETARCWPACPACIGIFPSLAPSLALRSSPATATRGCAMRSAAMC